MPTTIRSERATRGRPAPSRRSRQCRNGFTMIELLVVMLLITIVLSVTIPRFDTGMMQDPQKQLSRWMINTTRSLRAAAMATQRVHSLVVDIDGNRMWTVHAEMDEETLSGAADKAFKPGGAIRLVNVQFPEQELGTSGTTEIHFHPAGYSDPAMIHWTYKNTQRFSYQVEPLLPKVRLLEGWGTY